MSDIERDKVSREVILQNKIQFIPSIVALVGVPFAGKTTLGKAFAEKTNFTFCDVDDARWSVFEKRPDQGFPVELPFPLSRFAMNVAYWRNHELARDLLRQGKPVVLIATYSGLKRHEMLKRLSETEKVPMRAFLLEISDKTAEERLKERKKNSCNFSNVLTMEHYFEIKSRYKVMEGVGLISINTEKPIEQTIQEIFSHLSSLRRR